MCFLYIYKSTILPIIFEDLVMAFMQALETRKLSYLYPIRPLNTRVLHKHYMYENTLFFIKCQLIMVIFKSRSTRSQGEGYYQ